jgi:signal transduction histidine kinase
VVSAGQWVRLGDGREAMLYVSIAAKDVSSQLTGLAGAGPTIFGLVDPTERIVARSEGIAQYMFIDAARWMREAMETELPGALLHVPGAPEIGSTWDAGYHPLSVAPGWMAVAVQPELNKYPLWRIFSFESVMVFLGIGFSAVLIWLNLYRSRISEQLIASERARQEAESRRQDKSRLLASFAHDVRSPLVSMIGPRPSSLSEEMP